MRQALRTLVVFATFTGAQLAVVASSVTHAAVPVQVIVGLDPAGVLTIDALNARHATTTVDSIASLPGTYLASASDGRTVDQLVAEISPDVGVDFVEPLNMIASPEVNEHSTIRRWAESSATAATSQYANTLLDIAGANHTSTGAGVVVAVLDTGVSGSHPLMNNALVPGFDFVDHDAYPADSRDGLDNDGNGLVDEGAGHGTHVAGIVRQVAPGAKIMAVRVLDSDGGGSTWTLAAGIIWAADHGATVINTSLGGHGSHSVVKAALDLARDRHVTVVAAAGNDGVERKNFPASDDCVVAVASSGATDAISTFSTRGSWVAVSAPGEDVVSAYPFFPSGYATISGTSMSSPFVAGQVALLLSQHPGLTPADTNLLVRATAKPIASPLRHAGWGRIDLNASLAALRNGTVFDPQALEVDPNCGR
jgi:subtilisin family serine protease